MDVLAESKTEYRGSADETRLRAIYEARSGRMSKMPGIILADDHIGRFIRLLDHSNKVIGRVVILNLETSGYLAHCQNPDDPEADTKLYYDTAARVLPDMSGLAFNTEGESAGALWLHIQQREFSRIEVNKMSGLLHQHETATIASLMHTVSEFGRLTAWLLEHRAADIQDEGAVDMVIRLLSAPTGLPNED